MRKFTLAATLAAGLTCAMSFTVSAAPGSGLANPASGETLVEQVQAFHRNCVWINNGWRYKRGNSYVVCRPNRPRGPGWVWHREGPRFGWYHSGRKRWHYDRW